MAKFNVTMFPAREGDCLLLEYGHHAETRRILIDGGRSATYKQLREYLAELPEDEREFELLVVSHIDRDHIEGALAFMRDPDCPVTFKDVWFNGYRHLEDAGVEPMGANQGEELLAWLKQQATKWNAAFGGGTIVCRDDRALPVIELEGGMTLTVVSPSPEKLAALKIAWEKECEKLDITPGDGYEIEAHGYEAMGLADVNSLAATDFVPDTAPANGSSIAIVAEFMGKRFLLAADAHPEILEKNIKRMAGDTKLKLDAFKVSHHGSEHNVSQSLLKSVDCDTYLISTNGNYFSHPSAIAISRIIKHGKAKRICFNYLSEFTKPWGKPATMNQWGYQAHYPEVDEEGIFRLSLL
jgi:beta-lactamase superfamily II metal-dependent hydrolase